MTRATKIVATSARVERPEVLERLLRAGVDVVRLNFSHGTAADTSRAPSSCARWRTGWARRWR